jgi:hypothetical protein
MIAEVAKALGRHGGVAVIEAPTGTGKSMAYLIAGVEVARFQKKKLLIATATVALQEQLVQRDIPLYLRSTASRPRWRWPRAAAATCARATCDGRQQPQRFRPDGPGRHSMPTWRYGSSRRSRATSRRWQAQRRVRPANGMATWTAAPEPVSDLLRPMVTTSAGGCTRSQVRPVHGLPVLRRTPRGGRRGDHRRQPGPRAGRPHHAGRGRRLGRRDPAPAGRNAVYLRRRPPRAGQGDRPRRRRGLHEPQRAPAEPARPAGACGVFAHRQGEPRQAQRSMPATRSCRNSAIRWRNSNGNPPRLAARSSRSRADVSRLARSAAGTLGGTCGRAQRAPARSSAG